MRIKFFAVRTSEGFLARWIAYFGNSSGDYNTNFLTDLVFRGIMWKHEALLLLTIPKHLPSHLLKQIYEKLEKGSHANRPSAELHSSGASKVWVLEDGSSRS